MAWYRCGQSGGSQPVPVPAENFIYNIGATAFNTGHIHTANTKVVFKAILADDTAVDTWYGQAFGTRNGSFSANAFGLFCRFMTNRKYCFYRTGWEAQGDPVGTAGSSSSPFSKKVCIFTAEGNSVSWYPVDSPSTVHSIGASGTIDGGIAPLAIFCTNNSNQANGFSAGDYGMMRLYWFEIYESDVLVHRFIPAYNNNQYCLYDEVEETYIYDVANNGLRLLGVVN